MQGVEVVNNILPNIPFSPGVYKMLGADGKALYIGKARNLRKRLRSYTVIERHSVRIRRMIAAIEDLQIITTHTEAEALLLEANLIKDLRPRYNILLRDDKSYPMILIRGDHLFPQLVKHRGAKTVDGDYFGPFAGAGAVNRTLTILQKAFLLRDCSDSNFRNRTRPCLQYHIKRCSAPCVGKISESDYGDLVEQARLFLRGKSRDIQKRMSEAMQAASEALDFEAATILRDRIKALNSVQSRQDINLETIQDADIMALVSGDGMCCVQVFFYRGGCNYGNRLYFPTQARGMSDAEILSSFIAQFYANKPVPRMVLCNLAPTQSDYLEEALSQLADMRVRLIVPSRGDRRAAVEFSARNAESALRLRLADSLQHRRLLEKLGELLGMERAPETIEVYDNSHLQGSDAVGALIAVNGDGFDKKRYRKFNIRTVSGGDDYGMMREVIGRRFRRLSRSSGWDLPDLIILDGGRGQLSAAMEVIGELQASGDLAMGVCPVVVAFAKGVDRHAGREVIYLANGGSIRLREDDALQFFMQRIRDESHRFVIGAHKKKRSVSALQSRLDDIPEVGRVRRRKLLLHFGSLSAVSNAAVGDLCKVPGISKKTAEKIHAFFHN